MHSLVDSQLQQKPTFLLLAHSRSFSSHLNLENTERPNILLEVSHHNITKHPSARNLSEAQVSEASLAGRLGERPNERHFNFS